MESTHPKTNIFCAFSASASPGTSAQGHKGTRTQGNKGTRAQGHKGTRAHGHKGTKAQGHIGTRAQGLKGTKAQGHKGTTSLGPWIAIPPQRSSGIDTAINGWQSGIDVALKSLVQKVFFSLAV